MRAKSATKLTDADMTKCSRVFWFVLLFAFLFCEPSVAASYVVEIKQVNPEGEAQRIICKDLSECLLPVVFESDQQKQEPLIVHVDFVPGNVTFKFQTPAGYLYAGGNNGASDLVWHKALGRDNQAREAVTLYLPAVPESVLSSVYKSPVLNVTNDPVADFQITIAPAQ